MLGELIATGHGKRTGRRIVDTNPLAVEASFEDITKMLGVDVQNMGTYTSSPKPNGSLHGEGQGSFFSAAGDLVTWRGMGAGALNPDGSVSYRGVLSYSTASAAFARLNAIGGVFEFEIDAAGNTTSKIWEWK